ncbi:hypothetical protein [Brevibacillus laterosporus]|uniref:Uncharacterized protein n=1 Tax=Brevibacillus laterosporus TaxID=1465 RepID=A0AAP3G8J2_BRELA|nr:hypothetical protein [Brevibacillus laterosporus]MCR8981468.1 hypothetical protein [Brevibacillus laterosporus]MCZ0808623.1 hypothetical protein [Brevibacillus laterosporus]MCZ0827085.1 hypothetical protein [Brevibacillus laterosporus]MCZ0850793.1 hypothetical protein [Brevibacillus laterosporus]
MAFRRKKIKDKETGEFIASPVTCSICKEKRAFTTLHGNVRHGGKTCCDDCFWTIKIEVEREEERNRNYEMSEADYQTWGRL